MVTLVKLKKRVRVMPKVQEIQFVDTHQG